MTNAYFLNELISEDLTIIEKISIHRLRLFKELHIKPQIIQTSYSLDFLTACRKNGVAPEDVINIYDSVQGVNITRRTPQGINDYHQLDKYKRLRFDNKYQFFDGDRIVAEIILDRHNVAQNVDIFDVARQRVQRERFDERGFLSSREHFVKGRRFLTEYFSPEGELRLEKFIEDGKVVLINQPKEGQSFTSEEEFILYNLVKLIQLKSIVISERRPLDSLLAKLPGTSAKLVRLYNSEFTGDENQFTAIIRRNASSDKPHQVVIDESKLDDSAILGWQDLIKKVQK